LEKTSHLPIKASVARHICYICSTNPPFVCV